MPGFLKPVTIAGGGLAGLALGIGLRRRGVEVSLHEAGVYPRHRVCGEFVSGVNDGVLQKLGIAPHFHDATRLSSARWFDARGPVASLKVEAMGISRRTLDDRLQRDFREAGGILHQNSRAVPGAGTVWAAGRAKTRGKWIGLKCHARGIELSGDLEMHIGKNGYAGLARIENGTINICGLFRTQTAAGGRTAMEKHLRSGGLDLLADRIEAADIGPESRCGVAGFDFGRQHCPEFSIGDAARMIPPFTGNGMSMALESAACALDPLLEYAAGRVSWREAMATSDHLQNSLFRRRMAAAVVMQKLLSSMPGLVCRLARAGCVPCGFLLQLVR